MQETNGTITVTRPSTNFAEIFYLNGSTTTSIQLPAGTNSRSWSNVDPGTYQISQFRVVGSSLECSRTFKATINTLPNPSINDWDVRSPSCRETSSTDGKIFNISATGAQPITYRLEGKSTVYNSEITGLSGGIKYSFYAVDNNGCRSSSKQATIPQAEYISFSHTPTSPSCTDLADGQIVVHDITGGADFLSFNGNVKVNGTWHKYDANTVTCDLGNSFNGDTDYKISIGLTMNNSIVCTSGEKTVPLVDPPKLMFDPVNPYNISDYNGYNVTCPDGDDGRVELSGQGGTGTRYYHLEASGIGSLQNTSGNFNSGIGAGNYHAWLTDENDCSSDDKYFPITEPDAITFTSLVITPETCDSTGDASVHIDVSRGVSPYTYQWYTLPDTVLIPFDTLNTIKERGADSLLLRVWDKNACPAKLPVPIPKKPPIEFDTLVYSACALEGDGGMITLKNIIYGKPPYTYVFNGQAEQPLGSEPVYFRDLASGAYSLEVRDNNYLLGGIYADRCKTTKNIQIERKPAALLQPIRSNHSVLVKATAGSWYLISQGPITPMSMPGEMNKMIRSARATCFPVFPGAVIQPISKIP